MGTYARPVRVVRPLELDVKTTIASAISGAVFLLRELVFINAVLSQYMEKVALIQRSRRDRQITAGKEHRKLDCISEKVRIVLINNSPIDSVLLVSTLRFISRVVKVDCLIIPRSF